MDLVDLVDISLVSFLIVYFSFFIFHCLSILILDLKLYLFLGIPVLSRAKARKIFSVRMKKRNRLKRLKSHWFSLAMLVFFLIAWMAPGIPGAINQGGWVKMAAIMIIFFFTGLSLKTEEILKSSAHFRLHLYIQGYCYIFMPLLCWVCIRVFGKSLHEGLIIGFFLLSVLPTTISSCVVFTQISGGNFAGALFNAVLGNVLGIFASPALFVLMIGATDMKIEIDALSIIKKLSMLVLLPLAIGQVVHIFFRHKTGQFRKTGSLVNRWCILLIVYFAFGKLFTNKSLGVSFSRILVPLLLVIPGHLVILCLAGFGGKLMGFNQKDRITIYFCAPQKTLAMGLPLIAAVLATRPELEGLATLPVILYHPIQLFIAGFLVERFHEKMNSE